MWGTDVPPDFLLRSLQSYAVPTSEVGKLLLFADTLHYRLLQLTNLTVNATSSIRQELTAVRYMVLQNRMVLDLVTASQGGVCHIVGTSCCTYIPDNDADGGGRYLRL